MAENGRKDVFRARSGEKPTGQKGMEMGEEREREEICIADIAVRESAMPWKEEEGAKNGSEREGAQFMRFILASLGRCILLSSKTDGRK